MTTRMPIHTLTIRLTHTAKTMLRHTRTIRTTPILTVITTRMLAIVRIMDIAKKKSKKTLKTMVG